MQNLREVKGFVFDIQHYSIHDGPGIRTSVFLKGCILHCLWCHNPESQKMRPQIFIMQDKCVGCGKCASVCPVNAIKIDGNLARTNRELCKSCGRCVKTCPTEARSMIGKEITAGEVFKEVASDKIFYQESGGGVTLSGGEVLLQPEFSRSILELCKNAEINTAIETSGYGSWEAIKQVLAYTDLVLYDFKHFTDSEHKKFTGVSNKSILENAKRICHELKVPIAARIPVIPGYNDSIDNINSTARFIATELDKSIKVHLLPYHRLGEGKHIGLEQPDNGFSSTPPSEEHMNELKEIIESYGLTVVIGG